MLILLSDFKDMWFGVLFLFEKGLQLIDSGDDEDIEVLEWIVVSVFDIGDYWMEDGAFVVDLNG